MREIDGELEEVEEQFELVKQHNWQEGEDIVFLVGDCIGYLVFGLCSAIQPNFPLHSHIFFLAATTRHPLAQSQTAILFSGEEETLAAHLGL